MAERKALISTGSVSKNRKARFNYTIIETLEAGIVLSGSEVKSLRKGHANISESYASPEDGELFLINAHISEYDEAGHFKINATRKRKLLLHKKELDKVQGYVARKGYTIVPLDMYFNDRGMAKVMLGVAIGKTQGDKREAQKDRDWNRDKQRILTLRNNS